MMRRQFLTMALMALIAGVASGCASGLQRSLDDNAAATMAMQDRLEEMAQQNNQWALEVEALRRDMEQMGLKVTQTEEQLGVLNNKSDNLNTRVQLLTDDLTRLKREGVNQPAAPGALRFAEGPPATAAAGNVQAIYDSGLRFYSSERPRDAISEFSRVLETAPMSDLADNAEYWTGECYYKLREYPRALEAFKRVFNHQGSNKYEDAQLKIGMTYREMGNRNEAISALRELLQKYPNSQYVEIARTILADLGG